MVLNGRSADPCQRERKQERMPTACRVIPNPLEQFPATTPESATALMATPANRPGQTAGFVTRYILCILCSGVFWGRLAWTGGSALFDDAKYSKKPFKNP